MSIFSGIGDALKNVAGAFIPGLANKAADKITGVPTPGYDPTAAGTSQRQFFDASFPGTTAWERLGSTSPQPGVSGADETARLARSAQNREFMQERTLAEMNNSNARAVADMNNRASVISSMSPYGAKGILSGLDILARGPGSSYDRLPSELRKNKAEASRAESEARINNRRLPYTGALAGAEVNQRRFSNPLTMIGSSMSGGYSSDFDAHIKDNANKLKETILNRGRRPARFGA